MPSSPPKPFAGRARVASLTGESVFELRTEAVLSTAAPVPLESIDPNPRNPRQHVPRDAALDELVESIRQHGLLQPVVVRRDGVRRTLIAGHRRLAALQQLAADAPDDPRWRKVLAVERVADEDEALLMALAENLQREDLTPKDEAAALEVLLRQLGSTRKVAEKIHKSAMYVSTRLRVFEDPALAPLVLKQQLRVSTAEELLRAPGVLRQELANSAASANWTPAQARLEVANAKRKGPLQHEPSPRLASEIRALTDELTGLDATAVSLRTRRDLARLIEVAQSIISAAR